jgi:hypothetical protein
VLRSSCVRLSLVLATALVPALSFAQTPPALSEEQRAEARAALGRGNELFARSNFEAALTEFQRVYELLSSRPNRYIALFNIARCYERLFRYDQAIEFYQRFLSEAPPDDPDRVGATATVGALEGLLGTLEIESNVVNAQVWIDDRQVSEQVRTIRIPGGVHVVELRARGFAPSRQQLSLPARTQRSLQFRLERLNVRRGLSPAFFGAVTGLTVVSAITTSVLGAQVLSIRAEVDRLSRSPRVEDQLMVGQDQRDQIRTFAVATDIMLSVTVVSAVAATLLGVATEWRRPADAPTARSITVSPLATGAAHGVSVGGSL